MPSTFAGIEIGKRSLIAHTQGLFTIGHNMSNAAKEGYSRQRIEMNPADPIYMPALNREERAGQIGQGVEVERIERVKDMMLEGRIVTEASGQGYWEYRDKYILMLEQVYNEPSDLSVRSLMDHFWGGWQELSLRPNEMGSRRAVIQRGKTLVDAIHHRFRSLKAIRDMLEDDVKGSVKEVNDLVRGIAQLNDQIVKVKAMGDNPNDLLDRRDLLVNKLSFFIDISTSSRDPDEFIIHSGGIHLVQGKHFELLDTDPNHQNESYSRIIWAGTNQEAYFRAGRLAALVELRDYDAREEIQKLDLMTLNFIDMVNEIHREGRGLREDTDIDFFVEYPFINNRMGNYDRNGDGVSDSTYVFRVSGGNTLQPKEQIGLRGTLALPGALGSVQVEYYPSDTVEDLIERINDSGAEVAARLNRGGMLTLKAVQAADTENPDFVLRGIEDSGHFLVGYAGVLRQPGPAGAFSWTAVDQVNQLAGEGVQYSVAPLAHPSGWIVINEVLERDPGKIATSFDETFGGPGDGAAALAIAELRTQPVMIGPSGTFDDFFATVVTEIGLKGEQAAIALETENVILKDLNDMKAALSGVNIDEELSNMIKFQHAYNAAARFITEIDRMLDVIINRMGV
jgi:flagellar hook-associated protein 1 FlgK